VSARSITLSSGAEQWPLYTPAMSVLDLGASLRAERLRQGLSLRETARRLGISASALSQIETGKAHPSVGKLFDIVNLLNVSVDGLLAGGSAAARGDEGFVSLQRAGDHEVLELESSVRWRRLTAGSYPGVEFLHVEYQPGGRSSGDDTLMRHAGQEFGYVLSGRLTIRVAFDTHELGPGDSISFPATTPHRLSNDGDEPAHAIWCILGRHANV
jgi:transcriptional regulator with XRE-family HTH domain